MMEYFLLNEHSLPIARDIEDKCLMQFFDVYKIAFKSNFKQILIPNYIDSKWYGIQISEGRTILSWINDQPKDYATRIRSLISSIQCVELRKEDIEKNAGYHLPEVYYCGKSVPILGATYLLKQLAFSFGSNEIWSKSFFLVDFKEINNSNVIVNNVTIREHWDLHFTLILEERKKKAIISDDIEKRIKEQFPNIIFTDEASKQLKKEHSQVFLSEVWGACKELNEVIEKTSGEVSYNCIMSETNLDISDESSTLKKNPKLSRHRMSTYKGERIFFGYHIKNFSEAKRVHFIIDDNKIVIGYLGKHLPL